MMNTKIGIYQKICHPDEPKAKKELSTTKEYFAKG